MKTAVTVLNEMMIKMGQLPEYECISQSGPQHQATFEYRCLCHGVTVTGQARSKKEAKQEAARRMLIQLHARGLPVPVPFCTPLKNLPSPPSPTNNPALEAGSSRGKPAPVLDTRSYVALLKELCEEYHIQEPEYVLVGDTGPPHQRHFTMRVTLGSHERQATATTKKAARQMAAEQLYTYLKENLARLTKDFNEEEALARAHEKRTLEKRGLEAATARYTDLVVGTTSPAAAWRPDLGQRLAEYHLGLLTHIEPDKLKSGKKLLQSIDKNSEEKLQELCAALGLNVERSELPPGVEVLRIVPTAPTLAFADLSPGGAAVAALRYLRRALSSTDTELRVL